MAIHQLYSVQQRLNKFGSKVIKSGLILAIGIIILSACDSKKSSSPPAKAMHPGKILAQQHCASCHLVPEPEMLPKDQWLFTMIWMGNFLGYENRQGPFQRIVVPNLIPSQPLVSRQEMRQILEYYTSTAPEKSLPQSATPPVPTDSTLFHVRRLEVPDENAESPFVTMVRIDENKQRIWAGFNFKTKSPALVVLRVDGTVESKLEVDTQPIQARFVNSSVYLALIGDFEANVRNGQIVRFEKSGDQHLAKKLIEGHDRTSDFCVHDLNGDGRSDILVCGFGDRDIGRFSWFEQMDDNTYSEHVLIKRSGALNAQVADFNHDSKPDFMVLMTQGRNELYLFLNQGNGEFTPRKLFEQAPGFGYNHLCLTDFNLDGHLDFITVNGNNMENPEAPLRNYHGIRLYLNDGRLNFVEKYFYPMHGAMKAIPADFDKDGDIDIAAIAYFPDWSLDEPLNFVFLQNTGNFQFVPATKPEANLGRLLTMDAGDVDQDGDLDLLLGNALSMDSIKPEHQPKVQSRFSNAAPLLLLINKTETESTYAGIACSAIEMIYKTPDPDVRLADAVAGCISKWTFATRDF